MKSPRNPLSAAFCRTVKTPGRYGDGGRGSHGLYLRVWARTNGRIGKSWGQRLRINGRITNLGLGVYPVVTLAEAREKALENRREAYQGRDPRGGEIPTFAEAAEKVIRLHSKTWKPGSRLPAQWRQTLSDYAYPTIGQKRVNRIGATDVMTVLSPIWSSKPSVARVVRQRIGMVMMWAVAKGHRQDNPAGNAITSALPRGSGHVHHRALPHAQVGEALQAVRTSSSQRASRLAFEFVALTACRGIEVCGARWREMDLERRVWTIPATRMKSKREHRVPLSEPALAVLHAARDLSRGDLVFLGRRGKPVSGDALRAVLRRLGIASTVHGLRASFRSWASEQAVDREVAEAALAHTVKGVEAAYARSDMLERRRLVMEVWGRYITGEDGDD